MDKLKDFIEQHRRAFENEPLPEGHWERFNQRLDELNPIVVEQPKKRNKHLYLWSLFAAAACIALFIFLRPQTEEDYEADPMFLQLAEIRREFDEVQFYYQMQIRNILSRMEEIHEAENTEASSQLLSESKLIVQENIRFEKEIAPNLPYSPESLNALNLHYRRSLGSLKQMLQSMKYVKDLDNRNNLK